MDNFIYLDNAATTFPKPEVVYTAMDEFLRKKCVNAGRGSYELAQNATLLISETRRLLLKLINSDLNKKVIFSPSATIATNQILRGLDWSKIQNVYVSPFEHNAIMRTLNSLQKLNNFNINIIPFDNITFDLKEDDLKIMYSKQKPDVVIMSHVSNVTGYILPIKQCHDLGNQYNPINIVDCAQSLGIVDINAQNEFSKCDFIIFAGHKSLYGPFGIGGFISLNNEIKLSEVITGGTGSDSTNLNMPIDNESFFEAGSLNIYAIAGLNSALKWINEIGKENVYLHEKNLTKKLIEGLEEIDEIEIYIPKNLDKHIGIVSFNLNNYTAEEIGDILNNEYKISVRTGHHCAPLIGEFLEGYAVNGTVRSSVGYFNTEADIESFLASINSL